MPTNKHLLHWAAPLFLGLAVVGGPTLAQTQATNTVPVYAAGSLRGPLTALARDFEKATPGTQILLSFGASGMLLDRINAGADTAVFASANMAHPQALGAAGNFGPTQVFTRNLLCALVRPGLDVTTSNLAATLLRPDIKVGTSTPKADPSGDYAFEMFHRIERSGSGPVGSAAALATKALQLTGGPQSAPPPTDRNVYGALMASGQADVFITYCTNAVVARNELPTLQIVQIAPAINVVADYGLAVRKGAAPVAQAFADYLRSPAGQSVLGAAGFGAL